MRLANLVGQCKRQQGNCDEIPVGHRVGVDAVVVGVVEVYAVVSAGCVVAEPVGLAPEVLVVGLEDFEGVVLEVLVRDEDVVLVVVQHVRHPCFVEEPAR